MGRNLFFVVLALNLLSAAARAEVWVHGGAADFEAGSRDSTLVRAEGALEVASHALVLYGEAGVGAPHARIWDGASLGPEFDAVDVGATAIGRIEGAACTQRPEAVITTLDVSGQLTAQIWDGQAFGHPLALSNVPLETWYTNVGIAYESLTGRALVVYNQGAGTPWYRIWDGAGWSAAQPVGLANSDEPTQIRLAVDPGSNRMVLVVIDDGNDWRGDAWAAIWDGGAWVDAISLRADHSVWDQSAAADFMAASGRALVMWSGGPGTTASYRLWDGSWQAETPTASFALKPMRIHLSPEPGSDRLVMTTITLQDGSPEMWRMAYASLWDGVSWNAPFVLTPRSHGIDTKDVVSAAFEQDTGRVLVVYEEEDLPEPRYRVHDGTGWSTPLLAPSMQGDLGGCLLSPDPRGPDMVLSYVDYAAYATGRYLWDGDSFGAPEILESAASDRLRRPLLQLWSRHPPSYASPTLDSGSPGSKWTAFSWLADGPVDASLRFQLAVGDADPPTEFAGPDGTPDTSFSQAAGSAIWPPRNRRFARYRAEFPEGASGHQSLERVSLSTEPLPGPPVFVPVPLEIPAGPVDAVVGDLDEDGRPDLVTLHPDQGEVAVTLATGRTSYAVPVHFLAGLEAVDGTLADVDLDGHLDAVVLGLLAQQGDALTPGGEAASGSGRLAVLEGRGDGTLEPPALFSVGSGPIALVTGDFNADRFTDVVVADPDQDAVILLAGDGTGRFTETQQLSVGSGPMQLAAGDLDGDGRLDIVASLPADTGFIVLLGDEFGELQQSDFFSVGSGPIGVALADLDADGALDVVLADPVEDHILVLEGDGRGGFIGPPARFATGSGPIAVEVGRFDGDCALDVATANRDSADVSVLLGDGQRGFGGPSHFAVGGAPSSLAAADMQQDGRTDLVVSVPSTNQIVILSNEDFRSLGFASELLETGCGESRFRFTPWELYRTEGAVGYRWSFGDGEALVAPDLSLPVEHTYTAPGHYEVTLVAEDAAGACLASHAHAIEAQAPMEVLAGGPFVRCQAELAGDEVCFLLDGYEVNPGDSGQPVVSLEWITAAGHQEVPPEQTSTELCLPTASLAAPLTATLLATNASGCQASDSTFLSLRPDDASITSDPPLPLCEGESTILDAGDGYASYLWSTGAETSWIEVSPGGSSEYAVTLTDGWGCEAWASLLVPVLPDPGVQPVAGLRLSKAGERLVIAYQGQGSFGHDLRSATRPAELPGASVVAHVDDASPFEVLLDTLDPLALYAVTTTSPCHGDSLPF